MTRIHSENRLIITERLGHEAWIKAYGKKGKKTALSWLASSARLVSMGCIGHVPEILDGDLPHQPKGCDAQAWGASEIVRVWKLLSSLN